MNINDINFFNENGYFVLKNAVNNEFCDNVLETAQKILKINFPGNYQNKYHHIKITKYNKYIKKLNNEFNLGYNFDNKINKILNFIANTKKSNRILNRSCISSFKTNNNSIHWHIDGWEHHSLNQPLHCTCVIAYSDINNGTYVAPESIKLLTRLFYENKFKFHAETVMDFSPLTNYIINKCNDIRQIKLKKGDMLIMHPFLLHSGNNNKFSSIRLLTNFHLYKVIDFKNPKSLIEKKIYNDLTSFNFIPNQYLLNQSKFNLKEKYSPIVFRKNNDEEYFYLKKQLKYLKEINIIKNKQEKNIMVNDFDNNEELIDKYNINIYQIIKDNFCVRSNN